MYEISFHIISTVHIMIQWTMWMRLNGFSSDHDKSGHFRSNCVIICDGGLNENDEIVQ